MNIFFKKIATKRPADSAMSLIEILLAVATFALLTTAIAGGIIYGVQGPAFSGTRGRAQQLLSEGNEAVRNIRDSSAFLNLNPGTFKLDNSGGNWTLVSISNLDTESEIVDGTFKRYVTITEIDGNKKITVFVKWPQGLINKTIELSGILTNWRDIASTPLKRGLLVYNSGTSIAPFLRQYDDVSNTFLDYSNLPSGGAGNSFRLETSPNKAEAIVAYVDNGGTLRTMCFDDSTDQWTQDWSVSVGGDGSDQRFVVSYESTSGDAFIAYTTNNSTTNEIAYRTKPGNASCGSSNWSNATNYDTVRTSGQVRWMIAKPDRRSGQDRIFVAWSDTNNDLSAGVFNGSNIGGEPSTTFELNLEYVSAIQDTRSYDLAVESASGNAMLVWAPFGGSCTANSTSLTASCMRYSRYTTAWSAPATVPTVADRGTNIDISANQLLTSNEIVLGAVCNSSNDLSLAYWSGSAWIGRANHDTSTAALSPYRKMVTTAWLSSGSTSRSIINYSDSNSRAVDWVVGVNGIFTTQRDFVPSPRMNRVQSWADLKVDPNSLDRLIYITADGANDLHVKTLTMTSGPTFSWSDTGLPNPIEADLPNNIGNPFSFSFWNVIPEI